MTYMLLDCIFAMIFQNTCCCQIYEANEITVVEHYIFTITSHITWKNYVKVLIFRKVIDNSSLVKAYVGKLTVLSVLDNTF